MSKQDELFNRIKSKKTAAATFRESMDSNVQQESTTQKHMSDTAHENITQVTDTTLRHSDTTLEDDTHVKHLSATQDVYTQKKGFNKSKKKGIRDTHYPTTYQVVNEMRAWIQNEADSLGRQNAGFIKAFVNTALYEAYKQYSNGELEIRDDYDKEIIEHFSRTEE